MHASRVCSVVICISNICTVCIVSQSCFFTSSLGDVDEAEDIFLKAEKDLSRLRRANERLTKEIRENRRDKEVLRRRTNALAYRAMEQGEWVAPIQVSEAKKVSRSTSQDNG